MDKPVSLMRKGFDELQEMSSRTQQNVSWKPPMGSKINLTKSSKAVRKYYEKQVEDGMANPLVSGYIPDVEELQKSFLMRPGCPRYSHRGTSTANLETHFAKIAGLPSNISTVSLTSQLSLDDWTSILQNTDLLESKRNSRYGQNGSTHSLSGLSKWRSSTEAAILAVPAIPTITHPRNKIPWYIAVLQEKDMALHKLAEELGRLSNCEAESAHKDEVISILREEVEAMQQKLDHLQWDSLITPRQTPEEMSATETAIAGGSARTPRKRGTSLPSNWEQTSVPKEFLKEIEELKLEMAQKEAVPKLEARPLNEMPLKDQEQLENEPTSRLETGEETLVGTESKEMIESEVWQDIVEETEEEMIIRKLFEFQKMNNELLEELEKMKNNYDIATGAIRSLERQLSFEGSQLRKAHAEQESLQKELRERGDQLEAMSNKFCNLREERKHGEVMGSIERENFKLRQDVADLESKLEGKSQLIDNLESNVSQLQAEVVVTQHNTGKHLSQQNELQRQLGILQRGEQQTRVILESISSRFERFRSKIIQATYSSTAAKSPQAELSDDEILDALQKIIMDRMEFHQMLKQQGVKVPPLNSEFIPLSSNKKSTNK